MRWFGRKDRGAEAFDEPIAAQEEVARRSPAAAFFGLGEGCEEIPGGYGPFGAITNPVPVNGPAGEVVYLNRLRTAEGAAFFYHRPGSSNSDATPHPVDGYEVLSIDGKVLRTIWFSPYFKRRSTHAPEGMTLLPFPKDRTEQVLVKVPGFGVNTRVGDFPHDLPAAIASSPSLIQISSGLGESMARRVVEALQPLRNFPAPPSLGGSLSFAADEDEQGWSVYLLDEERYAVDMSAVNPGPITSLVREAEAEGRQGLLLYAMLDMGNLSPDERATLASEFEVPAGEKGAFAAHFAWRWMLHELQGRPTEEGTYGPAVPAKPVIHWADVPSLGQPVSRRCRNILNALVERRG